MNQIGHATFNGRQMKGLVSLEINREDYSSAADFDPSKYAKVTSVSGRIEMHDIPVQTLYLLLYGLTPKRTTARVTPEQVLMSLRRYLAECFVDFKHREIGHTWVVLAYLKKYDGFGPKQTPV